MQKKVKNSPLQINNSESIRLNREWANIRQQRKINKIERQLKFITQHINITEEQFKNLLNFIVDTYIQYGSKNI